MSARVAQCRAVAMSGRCGVVTLAAASLLFAAGCSASHRPVPRPSQSGSPDVVLVVPYTTGVAGHAVAPSAVARIASAGACLAWADPRNRGGAIYEVHLRVPAARVSAAENSIQAVLASARMRTVALAAFRNLPTTMGARPLAVRC